MRSVADDRFDSLLDDDAAPADVPMRWSRWGRTTRRTWQALDAFLARLSQRSGGLWAGGFIAAWACYGMYCGGQYRGYVDDVGTMLGFGLTDVEIRGLASVDATPITASIDLARHRSLLSISAEGVREKIASLPWIADVSVEKVYPSKLVVTLDERRPYALWQDDGRVSVVDRSGAVMTDQIEERHLKLPLIVGRSANARAGEALGLIATVPQLAGRIHAAVLVAERRWNLVTNDGVELRLPQDKPDAALREIARLQQTKHLLDRDIEAVDLRTPDRLVIKLSDAAAAQRRDMLKAKAKKKGADT